MNRYLSLLFLLLMPLVSLAASTDSVLSAQVISQQKSAATQQRINGLDDETKAMLVEFRALQEQARQLEQENRQLEHSVGRQERQIARQQQSIDDTRQLMDRLDVFSNQLQSQLLPLREKIPYAPETVSRSQTESLDSPVVTERFLASLALWVHELDQSTRLYAWSGQLPDGQQVEFVRLGRVGLYYLTPDSNDAAMFIPEYGQWYSLPISKVSEVVRARDIARGDRRSGWLYLPILGIDAATATGPEKETL